mgnify:CR=1 FL=1
MAGTGQNRLAGIAKLCAPPPGLALAFCSIFDERPDWRDATERAADRWGVPVELVMAIIWKESSYRADVRPPKEYVLGIIPAGRPSSAYGYAQAIDGTWDWYREETGESGADRDDFDDAADFVGWYIAKTMRSNRLPLYEVDDHYIAYHEGHTGYRRGTWRRKGWLLDAARRVADQTARYRSQLRSC